jgi:hypothetical protein
MLNEVVRLSVKESPNGISHMKRPAPTWRAEPTQQNNKWVAEAVELRRQDEKDQDERKQKHSKKLAAFGAQLA